MGPEPIDLDDPDYEPGAHIWGWMTPVELRWLHETAAMMGSVIEIGVLRGRSGYALASGCAGPVYLVDPWDDEGNHAYPAIAADLADFANVHLVKGYSPAVAAELPDVDMTFIDGAHDEAQVRADIAAFLPKTRRLICGHDYSPLTADQGAGYPDVRKVVDEIFGDRAHSADGDGYSTLSIWTVDLS